MAVTYILFVTVILVMRAAHIPEAFRLIIVGAFNPEAVLGGVLGVSIREAIRFGVARGLFSNEAGMGSTPNAHASTTRANKAW